MPGPPRRGPPGHLRSRGSPLKIAVEGFDLGLVARSHGWYDLRPFEWDEKARRLSFVFLDGGSPVPVTVRETAGGLSTTAPRGERASAVRAAARRVLDLDADLSGFHDLCRALPGEGLAWAAERGAGRILRSPSLFEDAVKVLATTNCSWALTRSCVSNLVDAFGRGGAFPDAPFVAAMGEQRLRDGIRLGYRAPFLAEFAERVASGKLDLARWEDPSRPDEEVFLEIRAEKGFGPYAADTLGRLLGRHATLGLDSWSRKKVAELRFHGHEVPDAKVEKLYSPWGRWAGLAFWLDVTRDWHSGDERLWP